MKEVIDFIDANRERFVRELVEWVKIPAISDIPEHAPDVARNAEHLARELARWKPDRVKVLSTPGHPAVFAEWVPSRVAAPSRSSGWRAGGCSMAAATHRKTTARPPRGEKAFVEE